MFTLGSSRDCWNNSIDSFQAAQQPSLVAAAALDDHVAVLLQDDIEGQVRDSSQLGRRLAGLWGQVRAHQVDQGQ